MMKNKNFLFGFSAVTLLSVVILGFSLLNQETSKYSPRQTGFNQTNLNNSHGIAGALEYYHQRRKNIKTGKVEILDMLKVDRAVSNFGSMNKSSSLGLGWIEMGPTDVGGRTRAILIDKFNPARMYAGGVSGGLYISNTAGFSWAPYDDQMNNLAISSICQSANGDIYVGTGEAIGVTPHGAGTLGSPGIIGRGVYKSTDGGVTFDSLPSTVPSSLDNSSVAWASVGRLAADPFDNLKIYAATNKGLKITTDGGVTWNDATCTCTGFLGADFDDVKIGSDGAVLASRGGNAYLQMPGETVFTEITAALPGVSGASRLEMAIAPSDPLYMYCCATSGNLHNLYQSKDGGTIWNIIVPGGGTAVFSDQGSYDLALAVFPDDREHVIVGGVELFAWSGNDNTWDIIALTNSFPPNLYVHADKHTFEFHPNYNGTSNQTFFIGTDGGVYGSFDGGNTYIPRNTGYSVTQFYAMGTSREGWVAGGTQDNGNPFIDFTGTTTKSQTRNLPSGDGGYMQFSVIDPDAFFWESQGGDARRSPEKGHGSGGLFAASMCNGACDEGYNEGPWVSPLVHWESFNDQSSADSIQFVADQEYPAGSTIFIESKNVDFPFKFINPAALSVNDTIMVQDIVSSKLLACLNSGVWMTKDVLDFSKEPEWYKISTLTATCAEFSSDGDVVFLGVGTNVYRISGLLGIKPGDPSTNSLPSVPASISSYQLLLGNSQQITGLGVDPKDANNLLVTTGNYGSANHVHLSTNALGTGNFSSIQGNLPEMPVYDGIIEMNNSNVVIIATEYGVWSTTNAFDTPSNVIWTNENIGFPRVPSFMILQQTHANNSCSGVTNSGNIYVCTHGRGIWRSNYFSLPQDPSICDLPIGIEDVSSNIALDFSIYPNPVISGIANISYTIDHSATVDLQIYSIGGKLVKEVDLGSKSFGRYVVSIDLNDLSSGTYLLNLSANGYQKTQRLVILN